MFWSIPVFYPLDASSILPKLSPIVTIKNVSRNLPNVPWQAKLPLLENYCNIACVQMKYMVSRRLALKMFCFTHFASWNLKEDVICDLMKSCFCGVLTCTLINQRMTQWLMIICIFEIYPETTKTSSTLRKAKVVHERLLVSYHSSQSCLSSLPTDPFYYSLSSMTQGNIVWMLKMGDFFLEN